MKRLARLAAMLSLAAPLAWSAETDDQALLARVAHRIAPEGRFDAADSSVVLADGFRYGLSLPLKRALTETKVLVACVWFRGRFEAAALSNVRSSAWRERRPLRLWVARIDEAGVSEERLLALDVESADASCTRIDSVPAPGTSKADPGLISIGYNTVDHLDGSEWRVAWTSVVDLERGRFLHRVPVSIGARLADGTSVHDTITTTVAGGRAALSGGMSGKTLIVPVADAATSWVIVPFSMTRTASWAQPLSTEPRPAPPPRPDEPSALERPLSFWLAQIEHENLMHRTMAAHAIGEMGPAAMSAAPILVERARLDAAARASLIAALGRMGAVDALLELLSLDARAVSEALADVGPPAIPRLLDALARPDRASWAVEILLRMGPKAAPAAPALLERLAHLARSEGWERERLLHGIGRLGPAAAAARPLLLGLGAPTQEPRLRLAAAESLCGIGEAALALPIYADLLRADATSPNLRSAALSNVAKLGPHAEKLLPLLMDALRSPDTSTSSSASYAIQAVGAPAVPLLLEMLDAPEPRLRLVALTLLGRTGKIDATAIERLSVLARSGTVEERQGAVHLLSQMHSLAAVPALLASVADPAPMVRQAAQSALQSLGEPALPHVLPRLQDPHVEVRRAVLGLLQRARVVPAEALPALVALLKDDDVSTRRQAAQAIARVPNVAALRAIVPLADLLDSPDTREIARTAIDRILAP